LKGANINTAFASYTQILIALNGAVWGYVGGLGGTVGHTGWVTAVITVLRVKGYGQWIVGTNINNMAEKDRIGEPAPHRTGYHAGLAAITAIYVNQKPQRHSHASGSS
jgi:hypothetical protein